MMLFSIVFGFLFWAETPHPDYCAVYHKCLETKITSYFKQNGFFVVGSGGAFMDCIREVDYYLMLRKQVNEEEAVRIYLALYPTAKRIVNDSKDIRFYLYEYPVSPRSVRINISFHDQNDREFCMPHVAWMTNYGDEVSIYYNDPLTGKESYVKRIKCPELNAL